MNWSTVEEVKVSIKRLLLGARTADEGIGLIRKSRLPVTNVRADSRGPRKLLVWFDYAGAAHHVTCDVAE